MAYHLSNLLFDELVQDQRDAVDISEGRRVSFKEELSGRLIVSKRVKHCISPPSRLKPGRGANDEEKDDHALNAPVSIQSFFSSAHQSTANPFST